MYLSSTTEIPFTLFLEMHRNQFREFISRYNIEA